MYVLGVIASVALMFVMGATANAVEPWRTPINQLEIGLLICAALSFVGGSLLRRSKQRNLKDEG